MPEASLHNRMVVVWFSSLEEYGLLALLSVWVLGISSLEEYGLLALLSVWVLGGLTW
jgi:hypothetical protein